MSGRASSAEQGRQVIVRGPREFDNLCEPLAAYGMPLE